MIGHITIETNRFNQATSFYDKLLGSIGAVPCVSFPAELCLYGIAADKPMFGIASSKSARPIDKGVVIGFILKTRNEVDQFYSLAMSLAAREGRAPGARASGPSWLYEANFRDLDGYQVNAYSYESLKHQPAASTRERTPSRIKKDNSTDENIPREKMRTRGGRSACLI